MKKNVVSTLLVILCGVFLWNETAESANYDSEIALTFKEDVKGKSTTNSTDSKDYEKTEEKTGKKDEKKDEGKFFPNTAGKFYPKTGSEVNTFFIMLGLLVTLGSITVLIFRFRYKSKKR
ncbi:LPXTG cell wall anchor domain-containing protein [Enterococcus quebecensis]|uniref:Gram-positive cocci surface proteins LPxTG domain-containing protein n=1 Tax=Enterococcus quebecensis TaxID=903983 RepID=A0A1E5GZE3_9ENTE|nr:LPXTG cell wall anchor domain-containing protein [Enterococcus quebecensis]OEG18094.1 hypothetical protein BCR23_14205 [Enterococcus quebecensis]OJG71516.1 hypothetical protein RV12_GL001524 [Enterococcus quebecensis]